MGVDVGGSRIRAARVETGRVEAEAVRDTPRGDPTLVLGALTAAVDEVHRAGLPIGVGVAGQIDPAAGVVRTSPNLPGRNVPLGPALEDAFGGSVLVDNDVRMAAVGAWLSLGRRHRVLVALSVGTGIGSGVVLHGRPLDGAHNLAGEAGHATFRPGGELCGCGRRGCFEAYAGGRAVARRAAARMAGSRKAPADAREVALLAERGDPAAQEIWREAGEAVVTLAWNLVVLYDPEVLVLGGGVFHGVPELVDAVREHVASQAWSGFPAPEVIPGDPAAGVKGAAWAAWKEQRRG